MSVVIELHCDPHNFLMKILSELHPVYLYNNFHKIYTDASKKENGRTGIGITNLRSIRSCERLSELFQISNAELVGILKAILSAESNDCRNVVILTDSLNACNWIAEGPRNNYLVHLIREQISRLKDTNFILQWIPSHIGLEGNDQADDFANRGCYLEQTSSLKITYVDAQSEIKNELFREWQENYQHTSQSKGNIHFQIQKTVSERPWFMGSNWKRDPDTHSTINQSQTLWCKEIFVQVRNNGRL
ncbi:hypothetical protein HA402_015681 [Bradysia odoriphaga]|nr:hypothetical protein HA402_015681 [Bradysia odoriphaga]